MIKRILKAENFILMLAFITAGVFLWQHYAFIILDTRSISSDFHILKSLYYYDHFILRNYDDLIHRLSYPPLVYLTAVSSYILREITSESARLILVFYAAIFLYSMYGIGRELGGGAFAGLITLSAAASSSAILEVSRRFHLDFPQTALTALALLILIKTDGFKNKKYSLLLGIALSLSFLAKWSTAFFMILPLFCVSLSLLKDVKKNLRSFFLTLIYVSFMSASAYYYFYTYSSYPYHIEIPWLKYYLLAVVLPSFLYIILQLCFVLIEKKLVKDIPKEGDDNNKPALSSLSYVDDRLFNFGCFTAIFSILTSPWYFWIARAVRQKIFIDTFHERYSFDNLITIGNYLLIDFSFFPLFPLLMLTGIILLMVRYREYVFKSALYYAIPLNILFIGFLNYKAGYSDMRYSLSIVIFMAVLAGFWTEKLRKYKILLGLIILPVSILTMTSWYMISQMSHDSFKYYIQTDLHQNINIDELKPYVFKLSHSTSPRKLTYSNKEIIKWLKELKGENQRTVAAFMYPHSMIEEIERLEIDAYRELGVIFDFHIIDYWQWSRDGRRSGVEPLSPLLDPEDVTPLLIMRIKEKGDPSSEFIYDNLSKNANEKIEINDYNYQLDDEIKKEISEYLNGLFLRGEPLYSIMPLPSLGIHDRTLGFKEDIYGEELVCLNRMLFEKEFRKELEKTFNPRIITELREVDNILIIYEKRQETKPALSEIEHIFPGVTYSKNLFQLGEANIIALRLNRKRRKY